MDKAERRAQILHCAREIFAKQGYHAATIDDIVDAAGVARGTFYLYFQDKRAVFADLVDKFLVRIHLTIQHVDPNDPGRSVASQVRGNILRVISVFLSDRAMTKILLTDAVGLDADFDRKLRAVYEEMFNLLTESLRDGQQLGIVAPGDARVYAYLSVGSIKELLYQAAIGEYVDASPDRLADELFEFLCGGYLRIPPSPSYRP